jgi:hypothetical protein
MKAAPSLPTYADPKFIDLSNQAQGEEMGDELV